MIDTDDTRTLNNMCCDISYDDIERATNGEAYPMELVGDETEAVKAAVNIGIDSRLQACFVKGRDTYKNTSRSFIATEDGVKWKAGDTVVYAIVLACSISPESLPVLIRRLFESGGEAGESLAADIFQTLGFDDEGHFVGRDND